MLIRQLIVADAMERLGFVENLLQPFLPDAISFRHKNELSCVCMYAIEADELGFEEDCLKYFSSFQNKIKEKWGVSFIDNFSIVSQFEGRFDED